MQVGVGGTGARAGTPAASSDTSSSATTGSDSAAFVPLPQLDLPRHAAASAQMPPVTIGALTSNSPDSWPRPKTLSVSGEGRLTERMSMLWIPVKRRFDRTQCEALPTLDAPLRSARN